MLTGDENIVDVDFEVQWKIMDAKSYLFNIQNPETTVGAVAEAAMREIVGQDDRRPELAVGIVVGRGEGPHDVGAVGGVEVQASALRHPELAEAKVQGESSARAKAQAPDQRVRVQILPGARVRCCDSSL